MRCSEGTGSSRAGGYSVFSASSTHCEAPPACSHYSRTEPPTLSPPQKEQRGPGCLSCWALELAIHPLTSESSIPRSASAEKSLFPNSFQVTARTDSRKGLASDYRPYSPCHCYYYFVLNGGEEDLRAIYTVCGNGNVTGVVASWLIIIVNLSRFTTPWKHTWGECL